MLLGQLEFRRREFSRGEKWPFTIGNNEMIFLDQKSCLGKLQNLSRNYLLAIVFYIKQLKKK